MNWTGHPGRRELARLWQEFERCGNDGPCRLPGDVTSRRTIAGPGRLADTRSRVVHAVAMRNVAWRPAALCGGLLAVWIAIGSRVASLDHALLSVHMVQH